MTSKLFIQNRVALSNKRGLSKQIDVKTSEGESISSFAMMCGAIDDFIHERFAEAILTDIEEIEIGKTEKWEEGTEAYMFWLTREGVTFEFQYGENGPEKGGEITLAQFKLAVQTFLQFLRDPERKPIEVPFPE